MGGGGGGGPATNLALGAPYAWELHAPGQVTNAGPHYLDDTGNAGGSHAVHNPPDNFGVFSLGELTDGVRQGAAAPGGAGQPILAQHGGAPAANVIFDLGDVYTINSFHVWAEYSNY